jgi:hypothetical protein
MNGGLDLNKSFSLQTQKLENLLVGKMVSREHKEIFIVV